MSQIRKLAGSLIRVLSISAFSAILVGLWSSTSWSALTVELVNGYNLVVDSNVTSPATYAPKSAYIGARICNTGATTLNNVFVHVGDYIDGMTDTPGNYPIVNTDTQSGSWKTAHPHLADTGEYSLTHEASHDDATRFINSLAPGECRMEYWLISYPQCVNVDKEYQCPPCDVSIAGGIKPDDDLTLNYDIWATSTDIGVPTIETGTLTMRNEISASANKIWPNTTSKVPDDYLQAIESVLGWGTLGPDGQPLGDSNPVYPGQRVITTQGIWYDMGNVGAGFDNDGDLIPDKNAWMQPVGDPGTFDADCFRMVKAYGLLVVKLKTGGEQLIPFVDRLYFMNIADNTGVVGLVYYQFIATGEGCSAAMTPYQEAASGFDNEKFSADYGMSLGLESGSFGAGLVLEKTDGVSSTSAGSNLTYTVSAPNNTGVNLGAPDMGMPLVFREHVPAGTTYVAGSASNAANLTLPSGTGTYSQGYTDSAGNLDTCTINYNITGSAYTILYSIDNGINWRTTEPVPATGITDIQWLLFTTISLDGGHDGTDCIAPDGVFDNDILQTSLPAGKTAGVKFQVTVNSNSVPVICNTARLTFGSSASGTEAEDCTMVTGNNSISGTVFQDNGGTTGFFGNGVKDGDEAGVGNGASGVYMQLYYDLNADGRIDGGDILYTTGTADATTGAYSFTNLPDGHYIVVAKKYDGDTSDGAVNAVNDYAATMGWGNTTYDPNQALGTDQGIIKMTEDFNTVMLAVNIDLDYSSAGPDTIPNVNFGFAPPLEITKRVAGGLTTVDEGDLFDYTITLENRLPTVGHQGATGCEYTLWARTGATGSNSTEFTDPGNAYDASGPNRTYASAVTANGSNRWIYGNAINFPVKDGNITKVEALFFGFFDNPLTDDQLSLTVYDTGTTNKNTGMISTVQIDSYIEEPPDLDPYNAIAWNISALDPHPGSAGAITDWTWADFGDLDLEVNPSKSRAGDQNIFFLDAIGLRVTTDCDCEANSSTTLSPVPLQDTYDAARFSFVSADPPPTSVNTTTGVIQWDDVGPVLPGNTRTVMVTVRARDVIGTVTGTCAGTPDACNSVTTDYDSKDVKYEDGRITNDDSSNVPVDIVGKGEINGFVHRDTDNDGWPYETGDVALPGVPVTLYACTQSDGVTFELVASNKSCALQTGGNTWKVIATTVTDANGYYEFIGVDRATYIVEVGDTDGTPATGNIEPFGGMQTGEANDTQGVDGSGNALGHDCPTCNNTWGDPAADLGTMNQINNAGSEETISNVNFLYYMPNAAIFGNVWYDIDGDTLREAGEIGQPGFTVRLYTDPNGDGDPSDGAVQATIITNANGDYAFNNLPPGSYVIVVTPAALPTTAWMETVETTGGTGSLNNQIPVTVSAGDLSGSHDFGYTQAPTADIGDTLYYDFDGDGARDPGEAGVPNVTVSLYSDANRDGTIDPGVDIILATDITDSDGKYLFEELPNASYIVVVDTADPDFPTDVSATGDPDTNSASIGDFIWFDADGDGNQDTGESGIPAVTVLLYEDSNGDGILTIGTDQVAAAATTDLNGKYLFTRLNEGYYWVDVDENTLPSSALTLTGTDPVNTRITISDRTADTVLIADAGYSPSSNYAMGGRVWYDTNAVSGGTNVPDAGEAGIGGVNVTVQLSSCYPGCGTTYTATTSKNGFWMVTGLANGGAYTVSVNSGIPTGFNRVNPQGGGSTRTFTVSGVDYMNLDFGYIYNPDNDTNYAEDIPDDPVGSITGRVFRDADGDRIYDAGEAMSGTPLRLYDSSGRLVATTTSAADGTYSFTGVPIGIYLVEAIDRSGNYTTTFLATATDFTGLNIIYDPVVQSIPDSRSAVTIDGVHNDLLQDFGYQRFASSIGDTIYNDVNRNADQDSGEPGIEGVEVKLYLWDWDDLDSDGIVDAGETTTVLLQTRTTTADDPVTAEDEGGKYLFTNLTAPPSGQFYMVEVNTATLPGTAPILIGDPDTDGVPCTDSPSPDGCDSRQVVDGFRAGINYLGADFGYSISGSGHASFGDTLWIDSNGNGIKESGEVGVPYITVFIDSDNDGLFDWADANGNGEWNAGEGERWAETDVSGYYAFTEMADGTYNVKVLNDPDHNPDHDWPAGLSHDAVYEAGGAVNNLVTVTVTNGAVSQIDGSTCSNCNLSVDFGYRYGGSYTLSGTIGIDDSTKNGYLGATATTYSGVATDEAALAGVQVFFYIWNDDGDNAAWDTVTGILDSGDAFVLLGSTSTDASGDYSYSNLPENIILVIGVPDSANLKLTTTNANTSAEIPTSRQLYEGTSTYDGNAVTVMVRQALSLAGNTVDVDYAFDGTLGGTVAYDFGDLPNTYAATLLGDGGAQQRVTPSSIRLGASISTENNGIPTADATGDTYDDGITLASTNWKFGPNGAIVVANASAAGWLTGWIDFNRDGDFDDIDERVVNKSVSAGDNTIPIFVPEATAQDTAITLYSRFRIYPSQPLMISSTGAALDMTFQPTTGEVEDYRWSVIVRPTYVSIASFRTYPANGTTVVEWETSAEVGTAGFDLMRADGSGGFAKINRKVIPAVMRPRGGIYRYVDSGAAAGSYQTYQLAEVEVSGRRRIYGPYTATDAAAPQALPDDLFAVGYSREPHEIKPPTAAPRKMMMFMEDPAESSLRTAAAAGITPTRIRVTLSAAGLYRITEDEIAGTLGVSIDTAHQWITSRRIRMSNQGASVAWLPFDDDTGLYFYGDEISTLYTDTNVYWIDIDATAMEGDLNGDGQVDGADMIISLQVLNDMETGSIRSDYPASGADVNGNNRIDLTELVYIANAVSSGGIHGRVMGTVSGGSPSPAAPNPFKTTVHVEEDFFDQTDIFDDPETDYWFWAGVIAGDAYAGSAEFPFQLYGMAPGGDDVQLTLYLQGAYGASGNPEHHAKIYLNETLLGEAAWNGTDEFTKSFTVTPELFNAESNTLRIEGIFNPGVESRILVDGFELTYDRTYDALNESLSFPSAGNRIISVSGFSGDDICLLDLSNPRQPKRITNTNIDFSNGTYRVSFEATGDDTPYLAADKGSALRPDTLEPAVQPGLRDSSIAANYLIITSDELVEGAEELADYRRNRGLSPYVATVGDIYDEFAFGIKDPTAIKRFIAFAAANWGTPPQYVVLVGDGTYDYKDLSFIGDNQVPVLMTGTPFGLFASDTLYADLNADGTPDIPIGRIPVDNTVELGQVIAKITAFETNPAWNRHALMVADKPDKDAGDFPADSDTVAALLPAGFTVDRIYLPALTPAQANQQLVDGINAGAYLVNYIGHGGFDLFGESAILSLGDAPRLVNTQQYPVLVALTCLAGGFAIPGFDSLSEVMTLKNAGGTVAAWSPTGLSINSEAVRLNQYLFTAIFDDHAPTLGEAIKMALERYNATPHRSFVPRIYNLLGDPALGLR